MRGDAGKRFGCDWHAEAADIDVLQPAAAMNWQTASRAKILLAASSENAAILTNDRRRRGKFDPVRMVHVTRKHSFSLLILIGLSAASAAHAGDKASFVIPPRDGYGISECLAENGVCGRVVADSWCEAHGMAKASSFGMVDDVTAAIPAQATTSTSVSPPSEKLERGSYVINCEP